MTLYQEQRRPAYSVVLPYRSTFPVLTQESRYSFNRSRELPKFFCRKGFITNIHFVTSRNIRNSIIRDPENKIIIFNVLRNNLQKAVSGIDHLPDSDTQESTFPSVNARIMISPSTSVLTSSFCNSYRCSSIW